MSRILILAALVALLAGAARADFQRVTAESAFRGLVQGRDLVRFGIRLRVLPDGRIAGSGFGRDVTGSWEWAEGLFCRTLDWGSGGEPRDCQVVLRDGDTLRFIADRGRGDRADLRLR